ncbi:MAG: long-chain-fatty-acid--CoA ligase [Rhodopseudomonas palustris]|nr:MAG: long-chain-fatty-acid--CoA ligase [Rhodopseudomonas palustris]
MISSQARRHTISELLRRTARRMPDKTAVICGELSWSYRQFDEVCDQLSRGIGSLDVKPGDRVALLARNSHAFAAMRYAVARAGAVLVPINFMLNAQEIGYILRHSGARVLCTDSGMADTARAAAKLDTSVEHFVWLPSLRASEPADGMITFDTLLARGAAAPPASVEIPNDALAQILYTSGTESLPKGAMLTHDAVIAQYASCVAACEFKPTDIMVHAMPMFHCAQLDVFVGPMVQLGATNIIIDAPAPETVFDLIERYQATSFFAPPTVWIALLRSPAFDPARLRSLSKAYYGASIMPVAVLMEMQERLPQVRFWNLYGQTEIAPTATILGPEDQIRKAGSAGKPVLNVETRVIDEFGNDVAIGEVGEIVHRSPQLMIGYFRDEERTAQAFEGGWFHSGDLGVLDDEGYLTVVDRKKDMIKSGGENVASREVEEAIYLLDGVSEVAVIGLADPRWIEAVTAIIVPRSGVTLTEEEVIAHCKSKLAGFKSPKRVIFAEALPRNPSGKILKRDLRRVYEATASQAAE